MRKTLLASAACLALLTLTAHAENVDRGHGHGRAAPAASAHMAPSRAAPPAAREGNSGRRAGSSANEERGRSGAEGHAMRGFGRSWNASGRDAGYMDNGRHRGLPVNEERRGRTWNASENGQDNNAGRDQNPNARRGHGQNNRAAHGNNWNGNNRPANNAWQGGSGRNAGWNGNARWHEPQNWRNDRAYWTRYHRSWYANRRYHWSGSYIRPAGWYYRRWTLGAFLPAIFFVQQYWIPDYAIFALDPPPPGTVWVRYGNDALLVDTYSGEIIQIVYGIFY